MHDIGGFRTDLIAFVREDCERDCRKGCKGGESFHGMRVFPLTPRWLEAVRHHGPIVARDVHRVGERPKDCSGGREADQRRQGQQEGSTVGAHQSGVKGCQHQGGNDGDAEQPPSRVNA
jgi:hypothetical protein